MDAPAPRQPRRLGRRLALAAAAAIAAAVALEAVVRLRPPPDPPPATVAVEPDGDVTRAGPASLARRGSLRVLSVAGTPAELGYQHARLLSPEMAEGERRMQGMFASLVPSAVLRGAMTAFVRARYHGVERTFPERNRTELAGEAFGYGAPPPGWMSPYERLVYLHAVYDIALGFEHSPLLGCTAFAAAGAATAAGSRPGHTIVARNFDFELDPFFDRDKVVQIVAGTGRIPFVSIAWAGLTGVVTGMNAEGVWVSVNGGRAGALDRDGMPVVFTTRRILEEARSLDEALVIAAAEPPMASHILLIADGDTGESAVVERAPGMALGVVRGPVSVAANHYRTTPFRDLPENQRVRAVSSTVARGARMEELVARGRGALDPAAALAILRDRRGVDDRPLALGDRTALDALIATHSVVADVTARRLWVSEGPHTLGAYRVIDLPARLARGPAAASIEAPDDLPADPLLERDEWQRVRAPAANGAPG